MCFGVSQIKYGMQHLPSQSSGKLWQQRTTKLNAIGLAADKLLRLLALFNIG